MDKKEVFEMSEIRHTPGPWEFDPDTEEITNGSVALALVFGADDFSCLDEERNKVYQECLANARLMAAAPDLLAACKALVRRWYNDDAFGFSSPEEARLVRQAKLAIERAVEEAA